MSNPLTRFEVLILIDISKGNINGDPDTGNSPRLDGQGYGFITDVCIKRKIRNWFDTVHGGEPGGDIHVRNRGFREDNQRDALAHAKGSKDTKDKRGIKEKARDFMCKKFRDVRLFGAVLPGKESKDESGAVEGYACGQVRGPVQMSFFTSIDPITPQDTPITNCGLQSRVADKPGQPGTGNVDETGDHAKHGTFGNKWIAPYGLYQGTLYYNPYLGAQTGVISTDLDYLLEALSGRMWDIDRAASRCTAATQAMFVFEHDTALGNAAPHKLFALITVKKKVEEPRSFADYEVLVAGKELEEGKSMTNKDNPLIPKGVKITRMGYAAMEAAA